MNFTPAIAPFRESVKDDEFDKRASQLYDEAQADDSQEYDSFDDAESDVKGLENADEMYDLDTLEDGRKRVRARRYFSRKLGRKLVRIPNAERPGGRGLGLLETWSRRGDIIAPQSNTCQVKPGASTFIRHIYQTAKQMLQAWSVIHAPNVVKVSASSAAVAGAATIVALTAAMGTKAGGVNIRWGDQLTNADRRPFLLSVAFGNGGVTTTQTFLVSPAKSVLGVAILLCNNAQTGMVIGSFDTVTVSCSADAIRAGSWLFAETLNFYDIRP